MPSFSPSCSVGQERGRGSPKRGYGTFLPHGRNQGGANLQPELDCSRADYIPLPPSPPTWEVDGRDEFHREYNDPVLAPVFQAGFNLQHTKVVKLAAALSAEQRQGRVGKIVAQAYRKLIIKRMKAGQLAAAAKQSLEMFEMVPGDVQDVDKRRSTESSARSTRRSRNTVSSRSMSRARPHNPCSLSQTALTGS